MEIQPILLCHLRHVRALQHFQKTQLKLIRPHAVYPVKGEPEAVHILKGQPRDQIQVLMDIAVFPDFSHGLLQALKIHDPSDFPDSGRIGGLNPDLQLDKPGPHLSHNVQLFIIYQVRGYLKMKICHPVVVVQNVFPYLQTMFLVTVERPVHKLHLPRPVFQKKIQLPLHQGQTAETDRLFYGGQAVTAGIGTSPAALIIEDPVLHAP